jgi:hypothetical protein
MSSVSASSSSVSSTLPISFNISHLFNTPMDRSTYLCWKSQFEDILELHNLKDVVSVGHTPPPSKLSDGTPNPDYSKDKLVLSWIKATASPSIQTLLISCSTACEAWALLDKRLSPLSKVHLRTLRDQLRTLKKDPEKSVGDFLLHAKSLADSLTAAGSPISDTELIEFIIDGLGHEYKEFITSLHLRPAVSFDDFYDLLLQEEHLLKRMSTLSLSTGTALAAARTRPNQHLTNNKHQQNFQHNNKGQGRGRGKGRGHHFFDNRRSAPPPPDNRPPLLPTPAYRPPFNFSPACQICNQAGHIARVCPERGNFAYTAEAAMQATSTSDLGDPNWCLDSGATHHMTPSPNNLSNAQPYTGQQDRADSSYWQ